MVKVVKKEMKNKNKNRSEPDGKIISTHKIGEKTAGILREAETIEDIREYLARIHDIDLEKEAEEG